MPEFDRFSKQMPAGFRGGYHKACKHADLGNAIGTLRKWSKIQFQRNASALIQAWGIFQQFQTGLEALFLSEGMCADPSMLRNYYSAQLDILMAEQEEIGVATAACEGIRRALQTCDQPGQNQQMAAKKGRELLVLEVLRRGLLDVRTDKSALLAVDEIVRKRTANGFSTPPDLRAHLEAALTPTMANLLEQVLIKPPGKLRLPPIRRQEAPYDKAVEIGNVL